MKDKYYETCVRSDILIELKFIAKVYGVNVEIVNDTVCECADGFKRNFLDVKVSGDEQSMKEFTEMWIHKKYSLLYDD